VIIKITGFWVVTPCTFDTTALLSWIKRELASPKRSYVNYETSKHHTSHDLHLHTGSLKNRQKMSEAAIRSADAPLWKRRIGFVPTTTTCADRTATPRHGRSASWREMVYVGRFHFETSALHHLTLFNTREAYIYKCTRVLNTVCHHQTGLIWLRIGTSGGRS